MPLEKCRKLYGYARYVADDPPIETHRSVLFDRGGLYDWRRRLIPASAHYQGVRLPDRELGDPVQPRTTFVDPSNLREEGADDLYYWAGDLVDHYGHFLTVSLARLWAYGNLPLPRPKILVSCANIDGCFARPFIADLFRMLGVGRADFTSFQAPTMLRAVIVPNTSFEDNHFVHDVFGRMCRAIGLSVVAEPTEQNDTPIYISKAKLASGTARITNEDAFVDRLARGGVDIIYPEELSIEQQISLWHTRRHITGYLGSGMHTAAFVARKDILVLNHEAQVYSNQILMDQVNGHRSRYVHPSDLLSMGADDRFHLNFQLPDPVGTAEQFLRELDQQISGPPGSGRRDPAKTVDRTVYLDAPLGQNLSRDRPTMQSTASLYSVRNSRAGDSAGAVSGDVAGRYAFHTDFEDRPWWSVDLGRPCELQEIRIFNRLDIGRDNSRNFAVLTSIDGHLWREQHRREGEQGFGGMDGNPYRWLCTGVVCARFVKIELLAPAYFHLVQVEVFGDVAATRAND